MRKSVVVLTFLILTAASFSSRSQGAPHSRFRLGAGGSLGLATAVGDFDETEGSDAAKPRFAGGVSALADILFTKMLGVSIGVGLLGEGYRVHSQTEALGTVVESDAWMKILYLHIPLRLLLEVSGFQAGAGVALDAALSGKSRFEVENEVDEADLEDTFWDGHRRFNLGAEAMLGYAFAAGPIFIVPQISFFIHLLNNYTETSPSPNGDGAIRAEPERTERHLNVMFGAAVFYGL